MLQASTLEFLRDLEANNDREWFERNKKRYEAAKGDYEVFVAALIKGLSTFEPAMSTLEAKKCVFRIYRDVRFSKDKSPYKSHFGAYFNKAGKSANTPGYYFHLEPGGKSFLAGGFWMPPTEELKKIRQEIAYNTEDFEKIIKDKAFKKLFSEMEGERLKTTPKDYDKDHPAIEYLKFKSFTVSHPVGDAVLSNKKLLPTVVEGFRTMQPFIDFINVALS